MVDSDTKLAAMEVCARLAQRGSSKVVGACFYGSQVSGYARKDSDVDLLLVLEPYDEGVRYHYEPYAAKMFSVLAVDTALFEKDVRDAYLGEFVAGRLLTPYQSIVSDEYLREAEVRVKTRFAKESLERLVSDYPGLWPEIIISPVFFIVDKMSRRASIYPPVRYSYVRMLEGSRRETNLRMMSWGFERALMSLASQGLVTRDGTYYRIGERAGQEFSSRGAKITGAVKMLRRAASAYAVHGYAGRGVNLLEVAREFASKVNREIEVSAREKSLEEPEKHLYLASTRGPVSLSDHVPLEEMSEKLGSPEGFTEKELVRLGVAGLNSVYLIRLVKDGEERRIVAKRYRDWRGLKWFPLALWTVGVQRFALRGRSRMANEYSALLHLRRHGFAAPDIVYLSWADKVLYRQYVEGDSLEELARKAFTSHAALDAFAPTFSLVGRTLANVHATGLIVGDPKPENIVVNDREQVFFLDLEQAVKSRRRPTWDLAELLYYTSHLTLNSALAKRFAQAVLTGYVEAGDVRIVKDIVSPRFIRVFAVVSAPHVLRAVSDVCNERGGRSA